MSSFSNRPFKVRDTRVKEKFVVDDVYLNGYAKFFTPATTLVYLSFCRRANDVQMSWPSEKRLAFDTGLSERQVRYSITALEDYRLIYRERVRGSGKKWHHTEYTLVDKSYWLPPAKFAGRSKATGKKATVVKVPTKDTQYSKELYNTFTGKKRPVASISVDKYVHNRKKLLNHLYSK